MDDSRGKVLVVEDDRDIGKIVQQSLTEEGFTVSILQDVHSEAIRVAVAELAPDCILLDSGHQGGYGQSWIDAAWIHARERAVPVVMFTAHGEAIREAESNDSIRSRAAAFAAVLSKPFDIDQLLEIVAHAVERPTPFDESSPDQAPDIQAGAPRRRREPPGPWPQDAAVASSPSRNVGTKR
jgi:DNA-binding response OmpR family regulator